MNDIVLMGLIEFCRSASEKSSLSRSECKDTPERIIYSSGVDFAPCNGVIEKTNTPLKPHDVKEAINFFTSKNLPFVWWSNDSFLETQGFQFGGTMTGIALDMIENKSEPNFSLPNVEVRVLDTEEELTAFCRIISDSFGFNAEVENQYKDMCRVTMDQKKQVHFLAYADGIPVSTATLTTLPKSAGVWNCATLPAYRKKGIGTVLCSTLSNQAKAMNYQKTMAILMPKGMAWGVFNKLGYKTVAPLPFYLYGSSANNLEK